MNGVRTLNAVLTLNAFLALGAFAVPHIDPEAYPGTTQCRTRSLTAAQIKAAGGDYKKALITSRTGTKNIAVILVNFPSAGVSTSSGTSLNANLSDVKTYFDDFVAYYTEVSYGNITLVPKFFGTGTVNPLGVADPTTLTGGYSMPQNMEYYGCGDVDSGCSGVSPVYTPGKGGAALIQAALAAARAATGGPTARPGGTFDAVLIMHSGAGNESSSKNGDIWSAVYQEPTIIDYATHGFSDGAVFPIREISLASPLGVICHEFGHILALPDIYNTTSLGGTSVAGNWELMDSGAYLGSGENPAHMGAWCKKELGWTTPQVATERGSYTIGTAESTTVSGVPSTNVVKIPVGGSSNEYFLVEYRSATSAGASYDRNIPGSGLLLWHIDQSLADARAITVSNQNLANTVNSGSPHYGVSLITADGRTISNANKGNAGNAYGTGGVFTSPSSNNFSGNPSGVNVVNMAVSGANATFDVVNLAVTASQTILKALTYPNPAGKGYSHPSGEGHATVTLQLTRPSSDYSVNIYTLSGDLVQQVKEDAIALNITRSQDRKWIYEFVWDLKNGDGQHVAPGVYLILVRADGETKRIKTVIIR